VSHTAHHCSLAHSHTVHRTPPLLFNISIASPVPPTTATTTQNVISAHLTCSVAVPPRWCPLTLTPCTTTAHSLTHTHTAHHHCSLTHSHTHRTPPLLSNLSIASHITHHHCSFNTLTCSATTTTAATTATHLFRRSAPTMVPTPRSPKDGLRAKRRVRSEDTPAEQ
jgi:hypothetical protein